MLIRPDGSQIRLGTPEMEQGRPVVTTGDTVKAGIYRIVSADGSNLTVKDPKKAEVNGVPFAIVPNALESENLESLTDAQIGELAKYFADQLPTPNVAGAARFAASLACGGKGKTTCTTL